MYSDVSLEDVQDLNHKVDKFILKNHLFVRMFSTGLIMNFQEKKKKKTNPKERMNEKITND